MSTAETTMTTTTTTTTTASDVTTASSTTTAADTPSALQDDAPRDDEGLRKHYDVVVCGTGLKPSILACGLSRAGWSVLHCDAADYYGELDAVWTFPYVQETFGEKSRKQKETEPSSSILSGQEAKPVREAAVVETILPLSPQGESHSLLIHSISTKTSYPIAVGTLLSTPYGPGRVVDLPEHQRQQSSLVFELIQWKLANGCHARVHVGIPVHILIPNDDDDDDDDDTNTSTASFGSMLPLQYYLKQHCSIEPAAAAQARTILQERSRSLALDVTPVLVHAAGRAVEALITSGVADYLEWKSLEGLLFLDHDAAAAGNNDNNRLERVPCNKSDVFSSKLLGPVDKRRLMKFLQLAMDYGSLGSEEEEQKQQQKQEQAADSSSGNNKEVQSLNERRLNQGRSLARPQNKSVATDDMETLRACMDMPFATYLQEKQRLSPKLINLVRYALALDSGGSSSTTTTTVQEGMKGLTQHMASLGRFGTTAFLVPLYGSGELAQAFCRSAAVYGATYLLRRAPVGVVVNDNENRVTGVLLRGTSSNRDDGDESLAAISSAHDSTKTKLVSCSHVIVPSGTLAGESSLSSSAKPASTKRVLRRISVLRGKPLGPNVQHRHVVIYPPGTMGNEAVIYGLLLDETLNVAPHVSGGCTVVHLTTTVNADELLVDSDTEEKTTSMLQQVLDQICYSVSKDDSGDSAVDEIFHMTFSYSMTAVDEKSPLTDSPTLPSPPKGLHIVQRPVAPELAADPAFEDAARIFKEMVEADAQFLAMSPAMTRAVEERIGDTAKEEDDERMVLESAVNMISQSENADETSIEQKSA